MYHTPPKHPFSKPRQGQSVFRLDSAPGSGFRSRISTSCAECKRLKIKCLKNDLQPANKPTLASEKPRSQAALSPTLPFPCLTCIKRGCQSICPQGVLAMSSGIAKTRVREPIIPQTQAQLSILEYQNTITVLKRRVHELECALQDAHAKLADDTHPLLQIDSAMDVGNTTFGLENLGTHQLSYVKDGDTMPRQLRGPELSDDRTRHGLSLFQSLKKTTENANRSPKYEQPDTLTRAFGSLSIKEDGRSTYHAQNAGAWYYLQVSEDVKSDPFSNEAEMQHAGFNSNIPVSNSKAIEPLSLSAILTPDILFASRMFPMGAIDDEDISSEILRRIQTYIPDCDEAVKLVDNYYAYSSWLYDPISRPHFTAAIFNVILPSSNMPACGSFESALPPKSCPHPPSYALTLATFFMILAIGTHLDLDQPCGSPGTNVYYHLARAAVASDLAGNNNFANPIIGSSNAGPATSATKTGMPACLLEPGLDIVRILLLMAYYLHMSDALMGYNASWALMGLATKLASGIGLHRDPTKWKLDPVNSRLRQELFWELYTYDSWLSMPSGRPLSFLRIAIDLQRPYESLLQKYSPSTTADNVNLSEIDEHEILDIFKAWKHHFCFVKLVPAVEQAWGSRVPSYYTILVLDKVLREQLENIPALLRLPPKSLDGSSLYESDSTENQQRTAFGDDPFHFKLQSYIPLEQCQSLDWKTKTCLTMQRYTSLFLTQVALLLLHRPYFVQALNISDQPLTTKFAVSVLAVYRSSCTLVTRGRELYAIEPRLSPRLWYFWAQVFSAVTSLSGLVVRSPSLSLASSALAFIEMGCNLFQQIKGESNRAVKILPTILKVRDRARLVYNSYRNQLVRCPKAAKWDATLLTTGATQSRSGGHHESFADLDGQIVTPVLKEEEKNEISALVGETRLVDQSSTSSSKLHSKGSSIDRLSLSQSTPSQEQSDSSAFTSSFSTPMPRSDFSIRQAEFGYSYINCVPEETFPPSSNLWSQPHTTCGEFGNQLLPGRTSELDCELGDQVSLFFQQQSSHDSQLVDPFSLFRALGLDIDIPELEAGTETTVDTVNLAQFQPDADNANKPQLLGQNWIESHFLDSEQSQQLPGVSSDIVQLQDTDAALERLITHAMKEYAPGFDSNSNMPMLSKHVEAATTTFGIASDQITPNSKANWPLGPSSDDSLSRATSFGVLDSVFNYTAVSQSNRQCDTDGI